MIPRSVSCREEFADSLLAYYPAQPSSEDPIQNDPEESTQNNQTATMNTFVIPLYAPIFIQNKVNGTFLTCSSLSNTKATESKRHTSSSLFTSQRTLPHTEGLLNHLSAPNTHHSFSDVSSSPLSISSGTWARMSVQSDDNTSLLSSPQMLTGDIVAMSGHPITKFVYSGESYFHIVEDNNDLFHLNYKVLGASRDELIVGYMNDHKLSQRWHIGKCNSTNVYALIRSIENPRLKLYYNGTNVVLKEEKDNVAEQDDGYLWKFVLHEIPLYKNLFSTLDFNFTTTRYITKKEKLFVTCLPTMQLELTFCTALFGNLKLGLGNSNQLFRITNDGIIESRISDSKDKNTKLVITWDLDNNKIILAKYDNQLNQRWLLVPHPNTSKTNLFKIFSIHDPLYILDTYKHERHSLLCIKELEEDNEGIYWTLS